MVISGIRGRTQIILSKKARTAKNENLPKWLRR
jgi:hypothetical protein